MSDVTSTTGLSGAGGGDKLRITGMATGLDVDAMVKKMMASEQTKMDKLQQAKQKISWKQEGYQDIIKSIKDFQSAFFDSTSADKNILSQSGMTPYDSTVVDSSVAAVTPLSGAKAGKYTIKVNNLATGAGNTNVLAGKLLTTKLSDLGIANASETLNLNVGGTSDINITLDNTSGNATISDLLSAINNKSGGAIKASFSEVTKKLTVYSGSVGSNSELIIRGTSSSDLNNLLFGSLASNPPTVTIDGGTNDKTIKNGIDANFDITEPGESVVTGLTQGSNNFSLDGVNYNLTATGSTDFSISQNTDKVYNKIKDFITKYNSIVDNIQTKLTEKRNYDYAPLTDAQKSSMKDSDIAAWNDKAKQGSLRSDDNLENLLSDLKSAFTTAVSNAGLTFGKYGSNSIGLDFSSDYNKPAHIDIADDSKLKSAITDHGDQFAKMFTNKSQASFSGSYDATKTTFQEDGILTRVKTIFENNVGLTNVTINSAILTKYANFQDDYSINGTGGTNTLPDQLYAQDILIKSMTKTLKDKQEKYYQQFSKLETAMNQLNSQQQSLTSMLGG